MRAKEFISESIELKHEPTSTGGVQVYAYIDGKEAGWVRFTKLKTGQVKAAMVHVPERLRRQGIGSAMYKYARHELGLDIVPSDNQTSDGRAFWKKIHENIAEDSFDGIDIDMDIEDDEIMVTAMVNGRELGHVLFVEQGEYLMPQDLEVDERYQGQGIAAAMYDYVKSKGYKIRRSGQQTDAGAGFWSKHRPEQNVWESTESTNRVLFLGPNAVIVGQEHGKQLKLSDEEQQKIKDIADKYGAWYEGNGMDQKHTKGIIDDYKGSWDDDLISDAIKGYPAPFLFVLFSNVKENNTIEEKIGFDPKSTIFDRILDTQPAANYFPNKRFDAETLQKFLKSVSEDQYDFVKMSQLPATEKNVRKFFTQGEKLMFPDNWEEYPYRAGRVAKSVNDLRDKFLATRKKGVYVAGSDHLKAVRKFKDKK